MDFYTKTRNEYGKNYNETPFGRIIEIDGDSETATIATANGNIKVPAGTNDRIGSKKLIFETSRGRAYIPF